MLIPPKPWSAPNIGGYLSNQSLIMRVRGSTMQINQLFAQHRQGKLSQVCTLSCSFLASLTRTLASAKAHVMGSAQAHALQAWSVARAGMNMPKS